MKRSKMFLLILLMCLLLPTKVYALTENEIKEKKEVTIKSIPPKKEMEYYQIMESFNDETGFIIDDCNSTYTVCTIYKSNEGNATEIAKDVKINYEYDENVKKVVDGIMGKIPENGKTFYVEDIYAMKWILDDSEYFLSLPEGEDGSINPIKYSKEYNEFVEYNNFVFEPRMGFDSMFASYQGGTAKFTYNGTTYGFADGIGVRVNHVLYVDDNETDIIGALKTRLSKYFNIKDITMESDYTLMDIVDDEVNYYKDTYNTCVNDKANVANLKQELDTVKAERDAIQAQIDALDAIPVDERTEENNNDLIAKNNDLQLKEYDVMMAENNYNNAQSNLESNCGVLDEYASADAYAKAMKEELLDVNNIHSEFSLFTKALPNLYVITLKDSDLAGLGFIVIKDSSKIVKDDLEVITKDAKSGVTITVTGKENVIPLDTLIEVSKLTSGEEYNKIVSALEKVVNKDNIEMFDLKLFSKSAANYITKLNDGTFEVKLPISDEFKDKNLIVYYVDENNEVREYKVVVKDGYAIFNTDHFSVYTLAAKEAEPEPVFKLTYDFNGGTRQGEKEYVDESVAFGMDVTIANFVDKFGVTPPEGKEIDAIEINGTKTEFGNVYILDKDTTFKYIWKDIVEDEKLPDTNETKGETVPKTFDNIDSYIIMAVISTIVLIGTIILINKKKPINNK